MASRQPPSSPAPRPRRRRGRRLDGTVVDIGGSTVRIVAFDGRGIDLGPSRCTLVWASFAERYARSTVAQARPLEEWRDRLAAEHEWLDAHPATTDTSRVALIRLDEVTRPGRGPRAFTLQLAHTPDSHRRIAREGWARRSRGLGAAADLDRVDPFFSASLRVAATVITADGGVVVPTWSAWPGSAILRRRAGVDVLVDPRDVVALTDVDLRLACARGLDEGLGLGLRPHELAGALRFHSLVHLVDDHEWVVLGTLDLRGSRWTAREIGLGGEVVPFTSDEVVVQSRLHAEWDPCGLVALLLTGLAEAGAARRDDVARLSRALAALA